MIFRSLGQVRMQMQGLLPALADDPLSYLFASGLWLKLLLIL